MITTQNTRQYTATSDVDSWIRERIKPKQIAKYLDNGKHFLDEGLIERELAANAKPDATRVREILAKSLAIQTLTPAETATLLTSMTLICSLKWNKQRQK